MKEHRFARPGSRWSALVRRSETYLVALVLAISLILSLRTNTFFTPVNLFNILRAFSWIAVAAFGEALVLIIGGIDLSVGAVMALAGMVSALALQAGAEVVSAVGAGLLAVALVGLVNGTVISALKLPPFIVTLATMSVARGLVFGLARGWPLRDLPESYRLLGQFDLSLGHWPIPVPVLIMLGLAMLVTLLSAHLIVVDEPLVALSFAVNKTLLGLIQEWRDQGHTVIIASSSLDDLFAVTDRLAIFRDGQKVAERITDETSQEEIVALVVGSSDEERTPVTPVIWALDSYYRAPTG